jgi:citrate lyase beta subunit
MKGLEPVYKGLGFQEQGSWAIVPARIAVAHRPVFSLSKKEAAWKQLVITSSHADPGE